VIFATHPSIVNGRTAFLLAADESYRTAFYPLLAALASMLDVIRLKTDRRVSER